MHITYVYSGVGLLDIIILKSYLLVLPRDHIRIIISVVSFNIKGIRRNCASNVATEINRGFEYRINLQRMSPHWWDIILC